MHCRLLLSAAAFSVAIFPALADAQPGSQGPGLHGSDYHATPPLPQVMPSPMPMLPPPVRLAPNEVPNTPFPNSDRPFSVVSDGFIAHVERDGRIRFSDRRSGGGLLVDPVYGPIGYASFDLTDLLMDWLGEDPYVAQKLQIMDQTRPARIRRKANHEQVLMDRALADLPVYLQAVWTYPKWTRAQRRQLLFELWDEAAEDGNELIRDGGIKARVIISHFIAMRLPTGSKHAFTDSELERMNSERSAGAEFSPYEEGDLSRDQVATVEDEDASGITVASLLMTRAF